MKSNLATVHVMTAALVMSALMFSGCDDDYGSPPAPISVPAVPLDQFPGRYAQAFCAQNFKCCSATDIGQHTMQQCTDDTATGLSLIGTLISDGQTRNRVSYDAAKMGMCVAAVAQLSCDDWKKGFTLWTNQPDACKAAVAPKVAVGAACQQDIECTTAHCEGVDSSATPLVDGRCTILLAAAASCAGGLSCADGLYCGETSQKCVARKAAGQSCISDDECMNTCNLVSGLCSAYAGCAVGDSSPRLGLLSLTLVAMAALVRRRTRRREGRGSPRL
jgi:MYXO-CTERM domain-containing protein